MLGEYRRHDERREDIVRRYRRHEWRFILVLTVIVTLSVIGYQFDAHAQHAALQHVLELCRTY